MSMAKYSIIPKPQKYETLKGTYTVTSDTAVLCVPEFTKAGMFLSDFLRTNKDAGNGAVKFKKDMSIKPEGYHLVINNEGISVSSSDENGAFYGAVTLKIMLMQSKVADGVAKLNGADIYDYPKYSYRGGMVDEARHFFGVDAIKRILDDMAMLKMNKFHWHLSDDQGIRIESEEFPLLNEIGSKRKFEFLGGTGALNIPELQKGGDEYSRYYKKSEIREIVEYASKLCIDIVPEIDLPGHTTAFIAAYPKLSCLKGEYEVFCENGITKDVLCPGQEETYEFLEKYLKEVCELFPYKYFHLGGDEAAKGHKIWENDCEKCKQTIKDNNLNNGAELQALFGNRINKFLNSLGKTCIQWNDGIAADTDENIVGQYWIYRSPAWVKKESKKRKYIVSACPQLYFDFTSAKIPLKKVYNYNIAKSGFTNEENVLGIEFETWTEWIVNESALQFAVYPKIFAVSEISWTDDSNKNYKDFYKRLEFFKMYMDSKNINYTRVEKRNWKIKNRSQYHLGHLGAEYKYNEKLKKSK